MKVCSKRSRRNCDFFLFGLPSSPLVLPKMLSSPLKSSKTANYSNSLIFGRFSIFRAFTLEKPLKYGLLQVPPSSLNSHFHAVKLQHTTPGRKAKRMAWRLSNPEICLGRKIFMIILKPFVKQESNLSLSQTRLSIRANMLTYLKTKDVG